MRLFALIAALVALAVPALAQQGQMPMQQQQSMMGQMDTDKDGTISRDEFMKRHEQNFDQMDTDHDGKLSQAEIKAFRQSHMQRGQKPAPNPG